MHWIESGFSVEELEALGWTREMAVLIHWFGKTFPVLPPKGERLTLADGSPIRDKEAYVDLIFVEVSCGPTLCNLQKLIKFLHLFYDQYGTPSALIK